jgi:hypothetical protein
MASPLTVVRNDFRKKRKRSDVPTPLWLCEFIAALYPDAETVLDPAAGDGRLLAPFKRRGCMTIGYEIKDGRDFLAENRRLVADLCVCNPPFNLGIGQMLGSELFLRHIHEVCGKTQIALFAPMGFRLNQRWNSKRWMWLRENRDLEISSMLSLPLDCFEGVEFHSEVIFFNSPHLKPHYWLPSQITECAACPTKGRTREGEPMLAWI